MILIIIIFLFASVSGSMAQQEDSRKRFRASVVKVDITPAKPQNLAGYAARVSNGVMHPIFHRIVAMHDGVTEFFLISTEIGKMAPSQYDKVVARLKQEHGIDRVNLWWTVTHTHSAPEVGPPGLSGIFLPDRYKHAIPNEYTEVAEQKLIDGILEARRSLVPARLGVAWGFSQANINRRAIDVDGKASLGLNPDGETDRRIGVLRLEQGDGTPLALIANYPIHGTVMGPQNLDVSGDAPGVVMDYVEEKTGATTLFINGAAGNLAPIYSVYPSARQGHLGEFRVLLGDRILEANKSIASTTDEVALVASTLIVETPRKEMGWPSDMARYSRTTASGKNLVRMPVRFLKLNENIAIWSAPLELFCEISNKIRDHSPYPYTFYFGYSNGNLGYLPTERAWEEGGYEPTVSPFTPQAEQDLTEAVIGYLQGELRAPLSAGRSLKSAPGQGVAAAGFMAQDTVNKPVLVRPESDGSLVLTAENGRGVGPRIEYMPEWRAFGWFTADDQVEWDVRVRKPGTYEVFMEWSVSDKEAGKPFVFQAGNETLEGVVRTTGSWEKFETQKIGTIRLSGGRQKMVFKPKGKFEKGGALLDLRGIHLTRNP